MADVRIQDFNENWKPDTNNDFLMTFNDGSESKTRLRDAFYSLVPDGAPTHNNVFRGQNLGALNATHIANIQNGSFRGMFIGDYFSINGSNYVIAGINYKRYHGDNMDLGNHLVLMPSDWSKHQLKHLIQTVKQLTICKTLTLLLAVLQALSYTRPIYHKSKPNWNQTLAIT